MPTVIILDHDRGRSEQLVSLIRQIGPRHHIESFVSPEPALSWLRQNQADLMIVDSQLPGILTRDMVQRIRSIPPGHDLPLLMLTPWNDIDHRRKVLDAGATDLLATPLDDLECRARCHNLLTQRRQQRIIHERARWLEQQVSEATSEIRVREQETLLRLAKAGEYRDEETGNHVVRMARYSRLIAEQLGLPDSECEAIELAAPMHDIGKIGVPDSILRKPGRLNHQEYEVMKTHTLIGYEILKDSPSKYLQMGAIIALGHHERFNGTGYPNRLTRHEIPLPARIVSVADTYDALTSERPYKCKWSVEDAVGYLNQHRGNHFDPEVLDAFNAQLRRITRIQFMLNDEDRDHSQVSISA